MLHAHVHSFLQTLALVCLLVKLPSFRPSQIKFINAEKNKKKREQIERAKNGSYLTCMSRLVYVLMKIVPF